MQRQGKAYPCGICNVIGAALGLFFAVVPMFAAPRTQEDRVPVYYGPGAAQHLALPSNQLGFVTDLVYDPTSKRITAYAWSDGQYSLQQWSMDEQPTGRWVLPKELTLSSVLYRRGDRLFALGYHGPGHQWRLLSVDPVDFDDVRSTEAELRGDNFDRSLDRARQTAVRKLLKQFGWGPTPRSVVDSGVAIDGVATVDGMWINARYVEDELAMTRDLSVISQGWNSLVQVHVARKDSAGRYRQLDVGPILERVVAEWTAQGNTAELYSIVVTRDSAIFGLQDTAKPPHRAVIWMDITGPQPRVKQTQPGLLVRTIEQFK